MWKRLAELAKSLLGSAWVPPVRPEPAVRGVFVGLLRKAAFEAPEEARSAAAALRELMQRLDPADLIPLSNGVRSDLGFYTAGLDRDWLAAVARVRAAPPGLASDVLGVMSFHSSGYVREAAVGALSSGEVADDALPYLLLRCGDWVSQVRAPAKAAVRAALARPERFMAQLPLVVRLERSRRTLGLAAEVLGALSAGQLQEALESRDGLVRRRCFQLLTERVPLAAAVSIGLEQKDAVVRRLAAQRAAELDDEVVPILALFMAEDRFAPVRRLGVSLATMRMGDLAIPILEPALFDASAGVRDLARRGLRRSVEAYAQAYRDQLARSPSLGALAGLGETGSPADAPALRTALASHRPSWREAAVTGLARVDPEGSRALLLDRLGDPSNRVARAAMSGLTGRVSRDVVRELAGRDDPRLRRAAIRLSRGIGRWDALVVLLDLLGDQDRGIREVSQQHLDRWRRRFNRVAVQPGEMERAAVRSAIERNRIRLSRDTERWLRFVTG